MKRSCCSLVWLALGIIAWSGAAGLAADPPAKPAAAQPNILFIMSDDHAAHAISAYGSRINKTPNLDRLAREGMRFNNCFCTNSICGPSRAVILTGKYSHINGYTRNERQFDGSQPTVAKDLQKAGYQTAMIGKWHLGSDPTGFDYWNILPGQGVYFNPPMIEMGERKKNAGYVTDIITDSVLEFLQKRRDPAKPFFVMYHHKAPHRSWQPDEKHKTLYNDIDIPEPRTLWDDWSNRASAARDQQMTVARHLTPTDLKEPPPPGLSGDALTKWKYQRYIKDYLRCIASVDDNVGRVLDYLDQSGLAQNTIVIYTSDQGFFLGDHGWFDKRFMYEESLRMPFLIRWPGHIKPGSTTDKIVLNLDFAETFLDCAGQEAPKDMQGRSFRPILEGNPPADWRTSMYYRYYEFPQPHHVQPHYGVRTDRYKLIFYNQTGEWELFDLQKDREELRSVYADPQYADVVKELKTELERLKSQYQDRDEDPMAKPPAKKAGKKAVGKKGAANKNATPGKKAKPAGASAAASADPPATAGPKVLFEDRFDGKLADGWTWLREDPTTWRFRDGALEIRVEPGAADNVKNALVREAPNRTKSKFAFEVTVTALAKATRQYEQAGLTLYVDGNPRYKLVKERVDDKLWVVAAPNKVPMDADTVQLRLIVAGDAFEAQFRPDAKGEFKTVTTGKLPPGKTQVSVQCYQGPPDAEHWFRFRDFRILKLAD